MNFLAMQETPCSFQSICAVVYAMFHSKDNTPLNLPLSCEIVKKVVFGPRYLWARNTQDFGHRPTFSNRTHFQACGRFLLSSVEQARGVADEKKKIEERRIAAKPKSADDYVGRPNSLRSSEIGISVARIVDLCAICNLRCAICHKQVDPAITARSTIDIAEMQNIAV